MANSYDDSVIDDKVANLQAQVNLKAASSELSDVSAVHTATTTSNTNRIATLEAQVAQLQQMVASLSYQVSQLS